MAKPRVIVSCVANAYTGPDERIIEFSDAQVGPGDGSGPTGGLISFRRSGGRLHVSVYRLDGPIDVYIPDDTPVWVGSHQVAYGPPGGLPNLAVLAAHLDVPDVFPLRPLAAHWLALVAAQLADIREEGTVADEHEALTAHADEVSTDFRVGEAGDIVNDLRISDWDIGDVASPEGKTVDEVNELRLYMAAHRIFRGALREDAPTAERSART